MADIEQIIIPYPDFQLGQIIDPEKFDDNNAEIEDKINEVVTQVNTNTSDITTLDTDKADQTSLDAHEADVANPHTVTKTQVGLGNVDNTSDVDKPISTATQTALNAKASTIALNSHQNNQSNPHIVTKTQIGLSNVDNTSDVNKPISTATQTALNAKASTTSLNTQTTRIDNHVNGSAEKHDAEDITYSGEVTGEVNVKDALDDLQIQVDAIASQGSIDPEVAQARVDIEDVTHSTLKARLDSWDTRLIALEDANLVEAYFTESTNYTSTISILTHLPTYDDSVDLLDVYINGVLLYRDMHFTEASNVITLTDNYLMSGDEVLLRIFINLK